MKKIIICLAACAMAFGFYACRVSHCTPPTLPHDLKPIDCENYNDVATVYWHLQLDCKKLPHTPYPYTAPSPCDNLPLYVEGWGRRVGNNIILCPDSISAASEDVEKASNYINLYLERGDGLPFPEVYYYHIICGSILYREYHYNENYNNINYKIILRGAIRADDPEDYINE